MKPQLRTKCKVSCDYMSELLNIDCTLIEVGEKPILHSMCDENRFCARCMYEKKDEMKTYLYGCNEAHRWNGSYIYYCPLGLVFVAAAVRDSCGELEGAFIQGPLVMGEVNDTLHEIVYESMHEDISALTVLEPDQVTALAAVLTSASYYISQTVYDIPGQNIYQQDEILNSLYDVKEKYADGKDEYRYPLSKEKELCQLVKQGEKEKAQELLKDIIGYIYFYSTLDFNDVKLRIFELIVVISRAAIEAGADSTEVFGFRKNTFSDYEALDTIDELSSWMMNFVEQSINCIYDFAQIKHADVIYKAMDFIRNNYNRKLSLDDIAQNVYISRTYLSSLFKSETGDSLTSYINKVRVEKSKAMLLGSNVGIAEVAIACGFEDQSYYTKVFRNVAGISPKKFRDSGGRVKLSDKMPTGK